MAATITKPLQNPGETEAFWDYIFETLSGAISVKRQKGVLEQDEGLQGEGCMLRKGESGLPPVARHGSCCPGVSDGAAVGGGEGGGGEG